MKLFLIGREPICNKECEHYKEPSFCCIEYPPRTVHPLHERPCVHGIRQQRDGLLEASKDALKLLDDLIHDLWGKAPDKEIFCNLSDAIKKAEGD